MNWLWDVKRRIIEFDLWLFFSLVYTALALLTLIPTLLAVFKKVELNPGGASFEETPHFSDEAKKELI